MNVSLTPELEDLVAQRVGSGLYSSASEVVREALRLLWERDRLRELRVQELRREISRGVDQLDRGEAVPLDLEAIKARARRRSA